MIDSLRDQELDTTTRGMGLCPIVDLRPTGRVHGGDTDPHLFNPDASRFDGAWRCGACARIFEIADGVIVDGPMS